MSLSADSWSAIAAVASCITAFASLAISFRAMGFQANSLMVERENRLYETLSSEAARANNYVGSSSPDEWNFNDLANVSNSMSHARERIEDFCKVYPYSDKDKYKSYFKYQLHHSITTEMNAPGGPEEFILAYPDSEAESKVIDNWHQNQRYFDYSFIEDSDLDD
nr:hypothetical protein [Pantoea agglomerans]